MKKIKPLLIYVVVFILHISFLEWGSELRITRFMISTYLFLFLLIIISKILLSIFNKHKKKHPSYLFLINTIKIIACIIYLYPFFSNKTEITTYYIIHFFIAYFSLLIIEIQQRYYQFKNENNR